MKKVLLSLSLLALASTTVMVQSCNLKDKVIENLIKEFDFDGATAVFNIPVITDTTNTYNGDTSMVDLDIAAKINEYASGLGVGDIESITITSCEVTITNPDANNDASNFESASASAYSDINMTPVSISNNGAIPNTAGATTISLTPATVNLADYMKTGTKLYYFATVNMRKPTTKELNCTMKVKYHVNFKD